MTKEEYIARQKAIFERSIEDSFKDKPCEIELIPILNYRYVKPNKVELINERQNCYCLLCKNKTFYLSHIKPRTLICSECFVEREIDSKHSICTKRSI